MSEIEYAVQGKYSQQYGWEDVYCTSNKEESESILKDYQENEPQYGHRILKRKIVQEKENPNE